MKARLFMLMAVAAIFAGCSATPQTDYVASVNPKIGSGGHGHVFVGAVSPSMPG